MASIFKLFEVEAQNVKSGEQAYLYRDAYADPENLFPEYEHQYQSVLEDPVTVDGITTIKFGRLTQTFPENHKIQIIDFITNRPNG